MRLRGAYINLSSTCPVLLPRISLPPVPATLPCESSVIIVWSTFNLMRVYARRSITTLLSLTNDQRHVRDLCLCQLPPGEGVCCFVHECCCHGAALAPLLRMWGSDASIAQSLSRRKRTRTKRVAERLQDAFRPPLTDSCDLYRASNCPLLAAPVRCQRRGNATPLLTVQWGPLPGPT